MRILSKSGFAMLELMLVIVVIGIVATIAIPKMQRHKITGHNGVAQSDLRNGFSAAKTFYASYESYDQVTPENLAKVLGQSFTATYDRSGLVPGPEAKPWDIVILAASGHNLEICNASKGDRVYCIQQYGPGNNDDNYPTVTFAAGPTYEIASTRYALSWVDSERHGDLVARSTGQIFAGPPIVSPPAPETNPNPPSAQSSEAGDFPFVGFIALTELSIKNSVTADATLATNGQYTSGANSQVKGVSLGPTAPELVVGSNSNIANRHRADKDYELPLRNFTGTEGANNNFRLTNGQDRLDDASYSPVSRSLNIQNNGTVVLGSGVYNFCSINFGQNSNLELEAGAKVTIYLDSPDRPGSDCPPGSGNLQAPNSVSLTPPSGKARDLQIIAYGYDDGSHILDFKNSLTGIMSIYAPRSTIQVKNNLNIKGGIAANNIIVKNSAELVWDPSLKSDD